MSLSSVSSQAWLCLCLAVSLTQAGSLLLPSTALALLGGLPVPSSPKPRSSEPEAYTGAEVNRYFICNPLGPGRPCLFCPSEGWGQLPIRGLFWSSGCLVSREGGSGARAHLLPLGSGLNRAVDQWKQMLGVQVCGGERQGTKAPTTSPHRSPCGTVASSTPGTGVGQALHYSPHLLLPHLPSHIPLATKPDPSRSRTWQLSRERLIAQKEGGAWREEEGQGGAPALLGLGVGSGPSLQYEGHGQQGAALLILVRHPT